MTRAAKLVFVPIFLLQLVFFLYIALHRLVDGDEGFYLLASRLVLQHRTPYFDFFYTQAPLLPYIYGAWLKVFGVSWFSARALSACLTAAVGTLVCYHVLRETGKWIAGAAALLLFATSSLVFAWYPIVKTFSLATLCLFGAYVILARLSPVPKWQVALAGVLLGLSIDTRSYVVVVVPVFVWWIVRRNKPGALAPSIYFCGGLVVGLAPSLILFLASPDVFLFNNLGYHAMRSGEGLISKWQNKLEILGALFAGSHTGFQFSMLAVSCLAAVFSSRHKRETSNFAFAIAVLLGVVSLLPTPSEVQYFSMIVPLMIVVTVCWAIDFITSLSTGRVVMRAAAIGMAALAIFVAFLTPTVRQYLITGDNVPGISGPADAPNWTLQGVTAVSQAIDQFAPPGEQVVSFWPGYIFASHADPYPGFENDFGMYVSRRLSLEKRLNYHILMSAEMIEDFAHHGPRLVVIGNQGPRSGGPNRSAAQGVMSTYGYSRVTTIGGAEIYKYLRSPRDREASSGGDR
jgi:hypothetical protein